MNLFSPAYPATSPIPSRPERSILHSYPEMRSCSAANPVSLTTAFARYTPATPTPLEGQAARPHQHHQASDEPSAHVLLVVPAHITGTAIVYSVST
jgi:hypothetical protein